MKTKSPITPRKKPSQDRAKETVEKILLATQDLMREKGLNAVTTKAISIRAGIPVGSIYQYFPNKLAILTKLYQSYLEQIMEVINTVATSIHSHTEWSSFFSTLVEQVMIAEGDGQLLAELSQAVRLYPELDQLDTEHSHLVNEKIYQFLIHFGFKGGRAKLIRLSQFLININLGIYYYRAKFKTKPQRREAIDWHISAVKGLLSDYRKTNQ